MKNSKGELDEVMAIVGSAVAFEYKRPTGGVIEGAKTIGTALGGLIKPAKKPTTPKTPVVAATAVKAPPGAKEKAPKAPGAKSGGHSHKRRRYAGRLSRF
jgi:hypothetical protein